MKPREPKRTIGKLTGCYKGEHIFCSVRKACQDFDTSEEAMKQAVAILCSE